MSFDIQIICEKCGKVLGTAESNVFSTVIYVFTCDCGNEQKAGGLSNPKHVNEIKGN